MFAVGVRKNERFMLAKNTIAKILDSIKASRQIQGGLIVYGRNARIEIELRERSVDELQTLITREPSKLDNELNLEQALKSAKTVFKHVFTDESSQKLFLLTDGIMDLKHMEEVKILKEAGIAIFVFGFGENIDVNKLNEISSSADTTYVIQNIDSVDGVLAEIAQKLKGTVGLQNVQHLFLPTSQTHFFDLHNLILRHLIFEL